MLASAEAMTLVAKPVVTFAAVNAHFWFWAVIRIRPTHSGNISAKVSTIVSVCSVAGDLTMKLFSLSL